MPQCTSLRIAPTCNGLQEDKCSECLLAEMFHLPHEPSLSLLHPLHDMTKEEKNQYFKEARRGRINTSKKGVAEKDMHKDGVAEKDMHLLAQRK